jgi:hypothetical protein
MRTVTVYRFKKYDPNTDQEVISQSMGTREAISRVGRELVIIEDSGVEVDEALLDGNGMIDAKSVGP